MDQDKIDKLAESCKDVALNVAGMHPYHVADTLGASLSTYPDSQWLSYRLKLSIYTNTKQSEVIWVLPEPKKPVTMSITT